MTVTLAGYQTTDLIYDGIRTLVYRGIKQDGGQAAILKKPRQQYPTFNEILQLRHQYALTKNLHIPGIVKPIALKKYGNSYVLVMEDVGGVSLSQYLANRSLNFFSLEEFFPVAIAITKILFKLYQNRVIHKDIKPSNILINPETKEIFLIDFSIAGLLPRETQYLKNPNLLEGTLPYISPEQTGRMNRGIDYRSDFYSLGVTFYQLLAGQLPFASGDAMELVHCHIAKQPTPPDAVKPEIPEMVSAIIMKLMAKTAEERYQSATGLERDLTECWQQWQNSGKIDRFELGLRDRSDRFTIPEKLYGRETEVQTLLDAFERVAAGRAEMMLVAGFSGIGKTAAVSEIDKPIVRQRGYFIRGKFDQFAGDIPFSAFAQCLEDLMEQLLGESEERLQKWKRQILAALGEQCQVIIELVPALEQIVGTQPAVAQLSGAEAGNRFNRLFGKFIRVFTTAEHPLVIFLDDLQWADSASLKLIQLLMGQSETGYLFLVGAYRDNEVYPGHPLMLTLGEIGKTEATVNTITLEPLSLETIDEIIADTLNCSPEVALPLTKLVYQKTKGNPFFTNQFLKSLHEDGWIQFDFHSDRWECDLSGVVALSLTEDVVEFMASRLQKLPVSTREVLKLAACIGNQFDLDTLAVVYQKSPGETAADLWLGLQEGSILPQSQVYKFYRDRAVVEDGPELKEPIRVGYRFLHDRVQQGAYLLIPEDRKRQTHLSIGQLLLKNTPEERREDKIFDLVNQLNYGVELISDRYQREELASLNLMAGRKAKASTAYEAAVRYFSSGIDLLGENSWSDRYETTLALHLELAAAEFLNLNFSRSQSLCDVVMSEAKTVIHRVPAYETKMQSYIAQNQMLKALDTARSILKILGVELPESAGKFRNFLERWRTKWNLMGKTPKDLAVLPEMTDPYKVAAMRILVAATAPAYIAQPTLLPVMSYTMVNLSVKYGNCSSSAYAYSFYTAILCAEMEDFEGAYEVGKLALSVLERFDAKELKAKVYQQVYAFAIHWKEHQNNMLQGLLEGIQSGLETGDIEYASYCATHYCNVPFYVGENLEYVGYKHAEYIALMGKIKQDFAFKLIKIWQQFCWNLRGLAPDSRRLDGDAFSMEEDWRRILETNNEVSIFSVYLTQGILSYLFGEYKAALESFEGTRKYEKSGPGQIQVPVYKFYACLTLLALYPEANKQTQKEYLARVESNQKQMRVWVKLGPMNYQHKYDLVEAEKARVLGNNDRAWELYDRSIASAKENGFVHEEALANELAAKFYLSLNKAEFARIYLNNARDCYRNWGAKAKVEDLEKRYSPELVQPTKAIQDATLSSPGAKGEEATTLSFTFSSTRTETVLDFSAVLKASQIVGRELELEKLLENLMKIIIENAGAQWGYLMLPSQEEGEVTVDGLRIEAARNIENNSIIVLQSLPLGNRLPQSVIERVIRTKKAIVCDDARRELVNYSDRYLQQQQPKSLLCLPLSERGRIVALVYLENNLATGAFTSDRLEVLQMLSAQAAISIENARLYSSLEEKVRRRTRQLEENNLRLSETLQELKTTQAQLIQTEKMSSLGRMVAGVAHEINNPTSFIQGNINPVREYFEDLMKLIESYEGECPEPSRELQEIIEETDTEYLAEDLEKILASMKNGCDRIRTIVKGLRTFSRLDESKMKFTDLQVDIESTIMLVEHRLRNSQLSLPIEVIKEYGNLPKVSCYVSQVNQVFFHILNNAIDAINSKAEYLPSDPPTLKIIAESLEDQMVKITISDNGEGMGEETRVKIFDPFFTTKPVGKGTGLGLSTSYQIIVGQHGGSLTCSSQLGKGTEFVITLPVAPLKPPRVSQR
ncbi:MAG: AAA family ATPase [Cyanobacteriota bacterium]|nr:AAA family ATPase [Cyanobacteriota bacterium]